ncbi:hypothetical protein Naga_102959g1, partial [Nannochloropsis gaditana]
TGVFFPFCPVYVTPASLPPSTPSSLPLFFPPSLSPPRPQSKYAAIEERIRHRKANKGKVATKGREEGMEEVTEEGRQERGEEGREEEEEEIGRLRGRGCQDGVCLGMMVDED